jgi:PST family polysaccharide transporter
MTTKDLKVKALHGGLATMCSQAATFAVRVGSLMVLARLLDPQDFGIVGMVLAVTGVLALFKDFGLSAATVQHATITHEQKSTLFWLNLLVGIVLGTILAAMAPTLAAFYREPRLLNVTLALALGFPIGAAAGQHYALLEREMRFVSLAVAETLSLLISTAIAILMATGGFGYWSLVASQLAATLVSAASTWILTGWIPGPPTRRADVGSIVRFGGTVSLNGVVVHIAYNIEKVLLGRVWGATALGLYGRAYQLVNIPTENINLSLGGVAFAALSRLQNDPERLKSYFLKGYSLVLSVTLPITICCALYAHDLIFLLLGPKWQGSVEVFRLLTPTILIFAIINPFSWLLMSMGRVGRSLRIALVLSPIVIAADVIGLRQGPTGVALAYSTAMALWAVPHIWLCVHGTMFRVRDIAAAAGRPLAAAVAAAAASYAIVRIVVPVAQPVYRISIGGSALLLAYVFVLLVVLRQSGLYVGLLRSVTQRVPAGTADVSAP